MFRVCSSYSSHLGSEFTETRLDPSHTPALITIITTLLRDRSSLCIGSVIVAFEAVCPTRLDLLHQQYRRLCRILVDVDEWGQVGLMSLLLRYARVMLARPDIEGDTIDPDLALLLNSTEPLLQSRNPAVRPFQFLLHLGIDDILQVVLGATRIFYYAGPPSRLSKVTQPLLRLLPGSKEACRIVLVYISVIAKDSPVSRAIYLYYAPTNEHAVAIYAILHTLFSFYGRSSCGQANENSTAFASPYTGDIQFHSA